MFNVLLSGIFWSFSEKVFAQAVTFIVTIILARILTPEDYGVVALILVFITLANVFVTDGFGEALIQKHDATYKDFSTIFWCSLIFSLIIFTMLFIFAPNVGLFYNNKQLTPLIRVLALKLPISSISTIQHAYVSKKMEFKKFFFSTSIGTVLSGVIGIKMAYDGYGPWAIVWQYLTNTIVDTCVLFYIVPWRPTFEFDRKSAKKILNFGWKMSFSAFINSLYSEIRSIIIGKVYSAADLAQYKRGRQFPSLFITNINGSISAVIYPAMSNMGGDLKEIKRLTRRSMSLTSYFIIPLMMGLAIGAHSLVEVLLTKKWLPCVPFLQLACISYAFQPIQAVNCQAIKAIGRSDIYLLMEIVKKGVGITLLFIFMRESVLKIAICDTITVLFSMIISLLPNVFLIKYKVGEQIKDILPSILISLTIFVVVYPITRYVNNSFIVLFADIFLSAIIFTAISIKYDLDGYSSFKTFIKNRIIKK